MQILTVREAAEADMPQVASIYNHYIEHTTASFETAPIDGAEMQRRISEFRVATDLPALVAVVDDKIAGYAYAHPWKERAAYCHTLETSIYLADGMQGMGIGEALMHRLISLCKAAGSYRALIACITAENEGSIRFHSRLGFKQVSRFEEVGRKHGRWLDVVDMQLLL